MPSDPRAGAQQPFVSRPNPKGQLPLTVETKGALNSLASALEGTAGKAQPMLPGDSKVMLGEAAYLFSGTALPCHVTRPCYLISGAALSCSFLPSPALDCLGACPALP